MLSSPPTIQQLVSPTLIFKAPTVTAFIPEAHNLFRFQQGTVGAIPDRSETYRQGDCFRPADKTFPKITSSIISGLKLGVFKTLFVH